MKYSEELVSEVIERCDILEIIGRDVSLKRNGGRYWGCCPFHSEKTPSFVVTPSKHVYYCFGCHEGGNTLTFLMKYHNYTFTEAMKVLAEKAGISLPEEALSQGQRETENRRSAIYAAYKAAAGYYYYLLNSPSGAVGLRYLQERGLTPETIKRFGLGYSDKFGDSLYRYLKSKEFRDDTLNDCGLFKFEEKNGVRDQFWNRVMFPIMDERGRVIGFGGRVMGDGKPKYLNSPETMIFNKRRHLFALNYARSTREKNLILCEGYMDVITMHQAGFTNACASLGTALTEEQCRLMKRYTSEVLLMYDSDGAGTNAALRAIPLLKGAGIEPRVVNLTPHKDPDEFILKEGAEALKERLIKAESAILFEITLLSKQYRRSDPAEWTAFQREAAKKLASIPEELERENYLEAVCARFGLPREAMRKFVSKQAAVGTPAENYVPPRSGRPEQTGKAGAELMTQKLMLTYLVEYPESYTQVRSLIGPEDFPDPVCRRVAEELFRQLRDGRVSEAELIALFYEAEEQNTAAGLFHETLSVKGNAELDRAFTDTVIRLLRLGSGKELAGADSGDLDALMRFISRKKALEELEQGKTFHLDLKEEI